MNIKNILLSRVIPILLLAFIVTAVIAYQRGVYDFTFIDRPETVTETEPVCEATDEPVVTEPPETEAPAETEALPSQSDALNMFLDNLRPTDELISQGYIISDGEFYDGFMFAKLDTAVALPNECSKRFKTELFPERVPDETYNSYTTVMREAIIERPAVEVYMDYILVDNGETVDVLKNDGSLLVSALDISVYEPAYTRDKNDRPLFKAKEPSRYNPKNTITQYYYIDESGVLTKSNYSDAADGRGLYVNYPADFGETDNNIYRYYGNSDEKYGYGGVSGNMRTEYKYTHAFNYSEGLGAAVDEEGLMHFLSESLYAKINGQVQIYKNYNSARRRLLRHYIMPDTFGEESLGFFYFDRGLVRVRCQIIDAYHYIERNKKYIASDEDIIIRKDGTEFPTPTDYRVISYSNGVILLEKDGKYGYMDHTGKWILQPVYDSAEPFYEGLAAVGCEGKYGIIDTTGKFVVPMVFDYIGNASGGTIVCRSSDLGWVILNKLEQLQSEQS